MKPESLEWLKSYTSDTIEYHDLLVEMSDIESARDVLAHIQAQDALLQESNKEIAEKARKLSENDTEIRGLVRGMIEAMTAYGAVAEELRAHIAELEKQLDECTRTGGIA